MGVKGLNNFITLYEKTVIDQIDMRKEINNWEIHHNGESPIILIDLKEIPYVYQRDEMEAILGGRFDYYNSLLLKFLQNLQSTNAKLVFFMTGKGNSDDLPFLIPKTEINYITHLNILDEIEGKCKIAPINEKNSRFTRDVRNSLAYAHNLSRIIPRYGDCHITYIQHNQEIARYAKQHDNRILAILTDDTDFLAFEGSYEFWCAKHLNVTELICNRYCKKKLYKKLGLNVHQMPLLSALCGSPYLPNSELMNFLRALIKSNGNRSEGKILNVSKYVRRQSFQMINSKPQYDLEQISRDVFGPNYTAEERNAITNGLAGYDLDFEEVMLQSGYHEPAEKNPFLQFCKIHNSFIYKLITEDIYLVKDIAFIDFRTFKSKNYAALILPILMKICGILFKDDDPRPIERKICMKHAHDESSKLTSETIIYPPMDLPPLWDLIVQKYDRSIDNNRFEVLEWLLNLEVGFVKKVRDISNSRQIAAVIITLEYLVQQGELTAMEANAILYTEHDVRNKLHTRMTVTVHQNIPNVHWVRIAQLYVKLYVLISHCLDVCGLHDLTDLIKFDGPLFHNIIRQLDSANDKEMRFFESIIEPIWIFSQN